MRKVLFFDLSGEWRNNALNQMLEHNQCRHHPRSFFWTELNEIQADLQFGYNPDFDFRFYVDGCNDIVVSIDE